MIHWQRKVMMEEVDRLLSGLPVQEMDTLEISGDLPPFGASHEKLCWPHFDVCAPLPAELHTAYDLVVAHQVWEHLAYPYRAARHVLQMLRPGGYFLLTVPFLLRVHRHPTHPLDCCRWTAEGLRYFLEEVGFPAENIRTDQWGNRRCVMANFPEWAVYRPGCDLRNEPEYPVAVWGLARKPFDGGPFMA